MASISNSSITFLPYAPLESTGNIRVDLLRHLVCDRYEYYADDKVAHCYAALDYIGTIGLSDLTIRLRTSDLLTTIDTEVSFAVSSNRVEWTMDISDLPEGTYIVSAILSSSAVEQTFIFKKTIDKTSHSITYPVDGIEIFPMAQSHLANTTFATHAAVPLPLNIATSSDSFRLYENDVLIPSQVEVVGVWDKNNTPKWLHVYFNVTYVSGSPKTYKLKKASSPSNPSTNLSITDTTPVLGVIADTVGNLWTTSSSHNWSTGQPVKLRTTGGLPKIVSPIYPPGQLQTKNVYYARIASTTTFTLHPTQRDAWDNTNVIDVLDSGHGTHSIFTISSWYVAAANIGAGFGIVDPDTWVSVSGHGFTTGDKVMYVLPPGTMAGSVDALLDENKIYTVSVVNSTQFILFYNNVQVDVVPSNGYRNFYVVTTITVANNTIKYEVQRPFAGITSAWYDPTGTGNYGSPIADAIIAGDSGPTVVDNRGITWQTKRDYFCQVEVEQSGICQTCIKADGWYEQNDKLITPFCRNTTRIYSFYQQPRIRVEFATTIADNTYNAKIGDAAFKFPLTTGGIASCGIDGGTIVVDDHLTVQSVSTGGNSITTTTSHGWSTGQGVKIATTTGVMPSPLVENTTYYARVTSGTTVTLHPTSNDAINSTNIIDISTTGSGTLYVYESSNVAYLHQERKDSCRFLGSMTGTGDKSDGWFNIEGKNVRTTLFAKDFWQKFPKEVELSGAGVIYHQWPTHGRRTYTTTEELESTNIYNYGCFHQGKYLDLQLPIEYYETLLTSSEANAECLPRFALSSYADGLSLYNEFTIMFSPVSTDIDEQNLAKLIQDRPIALPGSQWCCDSQVVGRIAPPDYTNFAQVEEFVENAYAPFFSADVQDSYGQFNYGDGHHTWIPSQDRSSLHRTWHNNHYHSTQQGWQLFFRNQKRVLLDAVRIQTDHTASVDFMRWDEYRGYRTGQAETRKESVAEYQWHSLGSFYHCKGQVHWGAPGYGGPNFDTYAGQSGHFVDASGQIHAWLVDANRWSKDTYEIWYRGIRTRSSMLPTTPGREQKSAWYGCFWAYKYFFDPALFPYLIGQMKGWEGTSSGYETGLGNIIGAFSTTATNSLDGTWSKAGIVWTMPYPTYGVTYTKIKWQTPTLVRLTTTGSLPAPLKTWRYYWANVSARSPDLACKLYEYSQLQDCIDGKNTYITYADTGSGTHTMWSGTILETAIQPTSSLAGALWGGGLCFAHWWEQFRDPAFPQWVTDNNDDKYVEATPNIILAALSYEFNHNPYELEKWLGTVNFITDRHLHRQPGDAYDYWGSGPGPTGDDWFAPQWPYLLNSLKQTQFVIQDGPGQDDTSLFESAQSSNFGGATTLSMGQTTQTEDKETTVYNRNSLIRFDLKHLIGHTILSATLRFKHVSGDYAQDIYLYRVTKDWTETGATWLQYNGLNSWTSQGGDYTSPATIVTWGGGDLTFDAVDLVQDALDNRDGILNCGVVSSIPIEIEAPLSFASFEHATASWRPKLTITVAPLVDEGFQGRTGGNAYFTGQSRYTNGMDNSRGATIMILHDTANGNIQMKPKSYSIGNVNIQSGTLLITLNPTVRKHGMFGEAPYVPGEMGTASYGPPVWAVATDPATGVYYPTDLSWVRFEEDGQPMVYIQRYVDWADNTAGLYKMQYNGVTHHLLQPVGNQGEPEACIHHNYYMNNDPIPTPSYLDNSWAVAYIAKGYLRSLISNPVLLEIRTNADVSPSVSRSVTIYIRDANGAVLTQVGDSPNTSLLSGPTADEFFITMNEPGNYHPEPWYIEVLTDPFSWTVVRFYALDPGTLEPINGAAYNDVAVFGENEAAVTAIKLQLTGDTTMNGGLSFGGEATNVTTNYHYAAVDGVAVSGDATTVAAYNSYQTEMTGGVFLGGTLGIGLFDYHYTPAATDGISVGGAASYVNSEQGSGFANPLGALKRECVNEGNWFCVALPECLDSATYRDALIPAITVCVSNKEVTRSLQEEEVLTTT